jgi:pimeloyl-ACP methyl ester carboxylesterase
MPIALLGESHMGAMATHVDAGPHRISVSVTGDGGPAVVIEPAFGGNAQSWQPFAEALGEHTTVVTYDRAAYGTSSRAMDRRTPQDIARDLHGVLNAIGIEQPVVLVGHSTGGVCMRAFAALYPEQVAGMVLIDSSHEAQEQVLRGTLPWKARLLEALTVPLLVSVPRNIRNGADRRSIIREFQSIKRLTAADQPLAAADLGDLPLVVLTRAPGTDGTPPEHWRRWHGLHEDLARLSANSRHDITDHPGHYIHKTEPELVSAAIRDVLHSARTQTTLRGARTGLGL